VIEIGIGDPPHPRLDLLEPESQDIIRAHGRSGRLTSSDGIGSWWLAAITLRIQWITYRLARLGAVESLSLFQSDYQSHD
jgi:hypothetical protein